MLLKLLQERNNGAVRKVDGRSGYLYKFWWRKEYRAYVYDTDKQKEIDDLCLQNRSAWIAPQIPIGGEKPVVVPEPVESEVRSALSIMAKASGIDVKPTDSEDVIERLLAAYGKGGQAEREAQFAPKPEPEAETPAPAAPVAPVSIPAEDLSVNAGPHGEPLTRQQKAAITKAANKAKREAAASNPPA